jgi:hypothetical protein
MFFYVNDIVFAFTTSRKKDTENLIRRLKNIFDMRDLNSLNFFFDVQILQKIDTIWLIQNFYMNKLIKNYVINIEYKATTFLLYQSLMSYIDEMNQKRVHVYRQKMKSIYYSVIIIRSNIIKTAFELARHLTNFDSKHLKAADYCIKYLHVIKFLIIRYSNSENKKLNNQISSSNKKKSNKEMSSTSNSKLNRKTSSNKKNNDKQIFEKTIDVFFANDLDRKSGEEYIFKLFDDMIDWVVKKQFIVSIFIIEAKFFSMLHADKKLIWWIHFFQKLKFDSNQKIMIYNDNLQTIRFFISNSTRRHRTVLIKTINTKRLFFNELSIYRKDDSERIDKDFIITETSKVHQSIETRRCRISDQSSRMRVDKILLTLMTKEVWLSSCESIKVLSRKELYLWDFRLIKIWAQNL